MCTHVSTLKRVEEGEAKETEAARQSRVRTGLVLRLTQNSTQSKALNVKGSSATISTVTSSMYVFSIVMSSRPASFIQVGNPYQLITVACVLTSKFTKQYIWNKNQTKELDERTLLGKQRIEGKDTHTHTYKERKVFLSFKLFRSGWYKTHPLSSPSIFFPFRKLPRELELPRSYSREGV